ncbi:hypothetical protein XYCOK13_27960 [Xylanibacillus composti]|uniref:Flagellar protein FlaG n=1 Tax=Xylanibacillus composti TaxID=1572762 RepID=A0A8J4H5L0_9BACL|nr:flagellar protein FlaG [Xylanibacillus composti]GIQ69972.1 hypothetical protein XYCOK13_27960 [Xylanibacillus composti]
MSVIQNLDSHSQWSQARISPTSQNTTAKLSGEAKEEGLGKPKFDLSKLNEEQKESFKQELDKLNESIHSSGKVLRFKYNDEINQYYVEVLNAKTQEVVASLPPEFLIDLSIKMKELIGLFIDERR